MSAVLSHLLRMILLILPVLNHFRTKEATALFHSVRTCALDGAQGLPVSTEASLYNGLPNFTIVGLPDNAVKESKERIRSAILSCGQSLPPKRITVNLAPAHVRKVGSSFDFPIAVSVLASMGVFSGAKEDLLSSSMFAGELSLNGDLRPVR